MNSRRLLTTKYCIVNGDDFGAALGINRAFLSSTAGAEFPSDARRSAGIKLRTSPLESMRGEAAPGEVVSSSTPNGAAGAVGASTADGGSL